MGTEGGLDLMSADGRTFKHHVPGDRTPSSLSDPRVRAILADDMDALWVATSGGGLNRLDLTTGRFERFRHDDARRRQPRQRRRARAPAGRRRAAVGGHERRPRPVRPGEPHLHPLPPRPARSHQPLRRPRHLPRPGPRRGASGSARAWGASTSGTRSAGSSATSRPSPTTRRAGRRQRHRVRGGPRGRAVDRHLRRRPLRDGPRQRRHEVVPRGRAEPAQPAQRPGDGAAPRPPRRPLDRHPRRRPREDERGPPAPSQRYPHDPDQAGGPERPRRDLDPRGRRAPPVARHVRRRAWSGSTRRRSASPTSATTRRTTTSLSGDRVATMAEASDGRLWVATMETGLNLLDPRTGRFERFEHRAGDATSLPNDAVHSLYVDVAGSLWVGTHSGLSQLQADGRTFKTFTTRNGLASDVIYAIANDRQGRLWLSTTNGLSAFDPRTGHAVNYGVSNGLQAREFNLGAWYQSTSGELFFGGLNGFNAFVPDRIRQLAPGAAGGAHRRHRRPSAARRARADETQSIRLGLPRQGPRPRVRGPGLHRARPQPVLVQARGLRPRVGAPEREAQRHLHEPEPRPLHLPPARRQQRRPLERERPLRAGGRGGAAVGHAVGLQRLLARARRRAGRRDPQPEAQVRARGGARARPRVPRAGADARAVRCGRSTWKRPTTSWRGRASRTP